MSFFIVGTSLASTISQHALHNHHSQQTHSQSWCDWMCKASHAIQTPLLYVDQNSQNVTPLQVTFFQLRHHSVHLVTHSRGPPAHHVI
ncbi:MAG: hypothetical protein ACPGYT_07920 [Nitrospirales bacterium]